MAHHLLRALYRLAWLFGFFLLATPAFPAAPFVRGDVDLDGNHQVTDAVRILRSLFLPGAPGLPCADAADVDDSGSLTISDGIYLLNFLFRAGDPPPPPFPSCGDDPTGDGLVCRDPGVCEASVGTVTFYGEEFEADGVFYVLDRSPPHEWNGEYGRAKEETGRSLSALSDNAEFGLALFDRGLVRFPQDGLPARATEEQIAAALDLLGWLPGGGGTCPRRGLLQALEFAKVSTAARRVIFFVSDGAGTCRSHEQTYLNETLEVVAAENTDGAAIHSFGISTPLEGHEDFLRELAAQNHGTYIRVPPLE